MNQAPWQTDSLADRVEELTARLKAGKLVDLEAYLAEQPGHASELRRLFPALELLANASHSAHQSHPPSSAQAEALPLGQGALGDFLILREVGRGGMGVVYEAQQISLGRRVALKVLPFASTLDPKQLQRFRNEAQAAAHLHHQNIVPVFAIGCERGVHYYAMQFIEGQSLADTIAELRLQNEAPRSARVSDPAASPDAARSARVSDPAASRKADVAAPKADSPKGTATEASSPPSLGEKAQSPLSPQRGAEGGIGHAGETATLARLSTLHSMHGRAFYQAIARLGIQAAEALDYSHELGIIHRDVKPANLLVDGQGKLWIADFGLAHCQSQAGLTMTGDLVGTLRYMSPEQALAKRVIIDHRTDIYSLGATLYELLTGEPVFDGADRQELLRQVAFEEPKTLKRHNKAIPAELETIVLKGLEKNPADRYQSAKEMAEDLERFVRDEPIRARRPSLARRARGFCRRHQAVVWSAAVALATVLTAAAGVGWMAWDQAARQREAVHEDMRDAEKWQHEDQWPRALKALERAQDRIDLAGPESLRVEVEKSRREAAFVVELEKIPLQMVDVGGPDIEGAQRAYAQVFAANALDVATVAPDEIARRIKDMAIRVHVVRALDYWAYSKDRGGNKGGAELRSIAQMADDDPWRQQLRDSRLINDRTALERLAEREDISAQPPESFLLLANLLDNVGALPEAVKLLGKGYSIYPTNFMINYMLGYYLGYRMGSPAKANEGIAFARAAVALNPQSPPAYLSLGNAIGVAGKLNGWDDSLWATTKAIELNRDYAAAYWHYANGAIGVKDYTLAETLLRNVIKLQPTWVKAYRRLGYVLHAQERFRDAIEVFRKISDSPVANYNAACYAALASDGRGDGAKLAAWERTKLRQQALDWLRAELTDTTAQLNTNPAKNGSRTLHRMRHWQNDPDFNSLRGQEALAKLPEGERHAWQKLWDDVETLKRQAVPRGFIKDWLVLSELVPYAGMDGDKALHQKLLAGESMLRPRAGDQVEADGKTLSWKEHHAQSCMDFGSLYGPPAEHRIAYAVCYIHSDADRADLVLRVGSDDQALIYLNGEQVYRSTTYPELVLDEDETGPIRLRRGTNVVIFKVVNEKLGHMGSLHLVTKDGATPEGIEYRLTP